eukprot:Skav232732  [mRNA]  locus=scaffold1843:131315:132160:- [translate_table: standard]
MPPPPVNPNQHMPASFPNPAMVAGMVRPGFPQPALQLRPGFPLPAGMIRPAGSLPGLAVPSQPKRRAWSPHVRSLDLAAEFEGHVAWAEAGSRAIATASKDEEVPPQPWRPWDG